MQIKLISCFLLVITNLEFGFAQELYPIFEYIKARDTVSYLEAVKHFEQDKPDAALKTLRKLGKRYEHDAATLRLKALCLRDKQEYDAALRYIGLAIAEAPEAFGLFTDRATLWERKGNHRASAADLAAYLQFAADDSYAGYKYADALHELGEITRAIAFLQQFEEKDEDMWNQLAENYASNEQYDSAVAVLDRTIARFPDYEPAQLNRAIIYQRAGKSDLALETINAFLDANPSHGHAYYIKGWIYEERGWPMEAEENYYLAEENGFEVWAE